MQVVAELWVTVSTDNPPGALFKMKLALSRVVSAMVSPAMVTLMLAASRFNSVMPGLAAMLILLARVVKVMSSP